MDFWPSCGFEHLHRNERGWLLPTPEFFRLFLARPELALVKESCPAEIRLHKQLLASPLAVIPEPVLQKLRDPDVQFNYSVFLKFRDSLVNSGSIEAYYKSLFQQSAITIPPDFLDLLAQVILRNILEGSSDAQLLRAAELLFRAQQVTIENGQVLSADLGFVQSHQATGGLGELGRLLVQNKTALRAAQLRVLDDSTARSYFEHSERHDSLLDLTHEIANELPHGLVLHMTRARSGLKALARVLELWIAHFFQTAVSIKPESRIDDPAWRWHIGLDPDSSALLNDLYEGQAIAPERMQRLISLFRLEFADNTRVQDDMQGKPVYLGLCMRADGSLKLKAQNLLLNLPLKA
jgi:hypothetical protein